MRNPHGRKGSPATQGQLDDIRDEMLEVNPGWKHVAGGSKPERAVSGPNGEVRYADLEFELEDGSPFFVQTVDTLADGVTANPREMGNGIDLLLWGKGPVMNVPKIK